MQHKGRLSVNLVAAQRRREPPMITFTAISGAQSEDALCYVVQIDDVKILLDCGWSDKFDVAELEGLKQ